MRKMDKKKLKIAISLRLSISSYSEKRDSISRDWPILLEKIGMYPILIPNSISNLDEFLEIMKPDGIILSGGENFGENPERDVTEYSLIDFSIKNNIPLLGVCRGMQILNKFFGGSITKTNNLKHVNTHHSLSISDDYFNKKEIMVNSFHKNILQKNDLSDEFYILAEDNSDLTIEAFVNKKYPLVGIMWHPEREQNSFNLMLIERILKNEFKKI